jgi:hypothetical protein
VTRRDDDAGYWSHEDRRTGTSVRRESWPLLGQAFGATLLECTRSGQLLVVDRLAQSRLKGSHRRRGRFAPTAAVSWSAPRLLLSCLQFGGGRLTTPLEALLADVSRPLCRVHPGLSRRRL